MEWGGQSRVSFRSIHRPNIAMRPEVLGWVYVFLPINQSIIIVTFSCNHKTGPCRPKTSTVTELRQIPDFYPEGFGMQRNYCPRRPASGEKSQHFISTGRLCSFDLSRNFKVISHVTILKIYVIYLFLFRPWAGGK